MRFIDHRGRLFGIVNLLDLLVIAVIVMLISTVLINLLNHPKANEKSAAELLIKVFVRVPNEVARNPKIFRPQDKILAGNAVVEKVLEVKPVIYDSGYSDMVILVRANCVILNNEYYCANAAIKVNSLISLANPVYIFNNATIVDVEKNDR